jgi:outer membrane receptor protein involved in Fe transport
MSKLSKRSSHGLALLAVIVSAGQVAQADEASATESSASALQEVVVTAQKREEKLHDVPMGVTAITGEELDKQRIVDFEDLMTKVPALSVQLIAPGLDRLIIRGENAGSVGSTVATYVDDTPFGSSTTFANGSQLTGDFDTWDLQRVEVLRGPQGTLYGAGSEGGLLKYVTNAPDPNGFAAAVQGGGEDVAHGNTIGSVKGMVNVPIAGSAAFRMSGYYAGLPGYIDDPSLGKTDLNRGYRAGVRGSFLWQATDAFSVRLNAFGQDLHTDGTPQIDVVGGAGNPTQPPANQLQLVGADYTHTRFVDQPGDFNYRIYSADLNWNLGWATATSITSYGTSEQKQVEDATSIPLFLQGPTYGQYIEAVLTQVPTAIALDSDINVKKWTEELRLASSPGGKLDWQAGAFFTHESSSLDQALLSYLIPGQEPTGLPPLEIPVIEAIYKEFAGFGEVTYHFNPQFDLALGGRWSENKQTFDETISGPLAGNPPNPPTMISGESTGTDFTYSVAPRWHISQDTMLYGRIASGYRPGGPNVLPPGAPAAVPTTYQSDSTVNYELGTRSTLLDHRLSIDVAAFLINWSKIQLNEIFDNVGINANGGSAKSKGLEWTFAFTPVRGLTFSLNGAYVDAYLTSDAPGVGAANGAPLPYAPKWTTSLDGAYTWRAFGNFNAFTGATWSYVGSRFNDFSTSQTGTGDLLSNPQAELSSYNTVNLRAGLDSGRWTFQLYGKNVGDVRGITVYSSTGTPNGGGSVVYVQPRTIGALVTARF